MKNYIKTRAKTTVSGVKSPQTHGFDKKSDPN